MSLAIGPHIFEPQRRTLTRGDRVVELGQKASDLLLALLEAQGEPVSKAALMDRVWPDTVVEEGNLTVQIATLRRHLGTDDQGRDWIVTVPRLGYRLVSAAAQTAKPPTHLSPALAVMPFVNLGGDTQEDFLADGIVEDLITALSKFTAFAVIARSSSFAYKGRAVDVRLLAEELGMRYVLEGSLRRAGDQVRISAQLVDCESGRHLWADRFDGGMQDVFAVQDRITEAVAGLVEPRILRAEIERARRAPPQNLDAYELYLRALPDVYATRPEANARAQALLDQAIALDPGFAPALAVAAQTLLLKIVMAFDGSSAADRARAVDLARRALAVTQEDGFVLNYAGFVLLQIGREYDLGLALLRRAIAENPNDARALNGAGVGELMAGDLQRGADCLLRALRLSPNGFGAHWQLTGLAHIRLVEGNLAEALDWAQRSLAINPGYDATHWMLIASSAYLGDMAAAQRHLEAFLALSPGMTLSRIRAAQYPRDPRRIEVILEGLRLAGLPE